MVNCELKAIKLQIFMFFDYFCYHYLALNTIKIHRFY